jgi:hypothetical protein
VRLEPSKDSSGNILQVKVTAHFSEKIVPETLPGSIRLGAVNTDRQQPGRTDRR